ncbi:hypothetical protein B0H17DRAFT_1190386 [Mycena rosella]|uniref:Uncharacterized protein n=1 Tax=Mycena rosella TaxID=1033263 RepID=A0AAD7H2Z1_MYCRO|nr:hypothetical protein B0H17DRAFT_1190386 [Mycena rosella]
MAAEHSDSRYGSNQFTSQNGSVRAHQLRPFARRIPVPRYSTCWPTLHRYSAFDHPAPVPHVARHEAAFRTSCTWITASLSASASRTSTLPPPSFPPPSVSPSAEVASNMARYSSLPPARPRARAPQGPARSCSSARCPGRTPYHECLLAAAAVLLPFLFVLLLSAAYHKDPRARAAPPRAAHRARRSTGARAPSRRTAVSRVRRRSTPPASSALFSSIRRPRRAAALVPWAALYAFGSTAPVILRWPPSVTRRLLPHPPPPWALRTQPVLGAASLQPSCTHHSAPDCLEIALFPVTRAHPSPPLWPLAPRPSRATAVVPHLPSPQP